MGTLTGNSDRLPGFCEHKLPTSCRLTSIPNCCACADERAHNATYPTYIDGVGFVPRGTRWQRYCWFCKEFWENRVAATNLQSTQTRVPLVPDQSEFLEKWYEFYDGHRIIHREDGTEERQAVLGEPWKDVSPGHLPRTMDELRAGAARSAAERQQHIEIQTEDTPDGPSLEDALNQLMGDAEAEEEGRQTTTQDDEQRAEAARTALVNIAGQAMQATGSRDREYQTRRIMGLRRELTRMRHGVGRVIAGLRDLGEAVPDSATGTLASLDQSLNNILAGYPSDEVRQAPDTQAPPARPMAGTPANNRTLDGIQSRLDEANTLQIDATQSRDRAVRRLTEVERHLTLARNAHEEALADVDAAETDVRHSRRRMERLRQEQRTTENFRRVFGTREEMEQEDYVSPIGGLFTRAWDRFRVAEDERREERTLRQVLDDEDRVREALQTSSNAGERSNGVHTPLLEDTSLTQNTPHEEQLNEYYTMLREQDWTQPVINARNSGFPQSMLDEIRNLNEEERRARIQYVATLDAGRVVAANNEPEAHRTNVGAGLDSRIRAIVSPNAHPNGLPSRAEIYTGLVRERHTTIGNIPDFDSDTDSDTSEGGKGLDVGDDGRPEAKTDEEMTLKMECKVCYTQLADTACLPCGHLVLCQWCSEQHSPVHRHDRTRPRRDANCPLCRKRIKQKVRIYRA